MKACLIRIEARIYWIDDEGQEREGAPGRVSGDLSRVYGNLSGVYGDLSRVYGDLSGVSGNLSHVSGDLSGVYGDLSHVSGNIDDAGITRGEREAGISIDDLIGSRPVSDRRRGGAGTR